MEAIIFCGIQATGKTSFYKDFFLKTHLRISLDMLHTRNKELQFLQTCFQTQQKFVSDNTNLTKSERATYIEKAKAAKFKVVGYYFQSKVNEAIDRNKTRTGKELILEKGIRGAFSKLELPDYTEGFNQLFYVEIIENQFIIKEWQYEI